MKESERQRERETDIYYKNMRQLTDTKENLKNQASESSGIRAASGIWEAGTNECDFFRAPWPG